MKMLTTGSSSQTLIGSMNIAASHHGRRCRSHEACVLSAHVIFALVAGLALATSAAGAPAELQSPGSAVQAVYQWNSETKGHRPVNVDDDLPVGTVLWIQASEATTLHLVGAYSPPVGIQIDEAGYYPVAGLQVLRTTNALPADATLAHFDEAKQRWQARIVHEVELVSEVPDSLAPGEAIFIHTPDPTELQAPDPALEIAYYHQDHLGSSSVVTDGNGRVVEETSYYPFGEIRRNGTVMPQPYKFSQKERDEESRLHCFEARYLNASVGRFLKPDPKFARIGSLDSSDFQAMVANPQKLHLYAYVLNNPTRFVDPSGLQEIDPEHVTPDPMGGQPRDAMEQADEMERRRQAAKETGMEQVGELAQPIVKGLENAWESLETEEQAAVVTSMVIGVGTMAYPYALLASQELGKIYIGLPFPIPIGVVSVKPMATVGADGESGSGSIEISHDGDESDPGRIPWSFGAQFSIGPSDPSQTPIVPVDPPKPAYGVSVHLEVKF